MRKKTVSPIASVRTAFPELRPLFEQRREELGYESLSDYFFWMAIYDAILRRPHRLSAFLAHCPPPQQEAAVRELIENFDKADATRPGSLFEQRLAAAAAEEHWRLHSQIRDLKERVRQLEAELEAERSQAKFA